MGPASGPVVVDRYARVVFALATQTAGGRWRVLRLAPTAATLLPADGPPVYGLAWEVAAVLRSDLVARVDAWIWEAYADAWSGAAERAATSVGPRASSPPGGREP